MTNDTDIVNSFAQWQPDGEMQTCLSCQTQFSFLVRKHHCRCCGGIFCGSCADRFARYDKSRVKVVKRHADDDEFAPYRTCQSCYDNLLHLKALLSPWGKPLEPSVGLASSHDSAGSTINPRFEASSINFRNEIMKNNSETELTTETAESDRSTVRHSKRKDENFCPICNIDLSKFDAEEDTQTHVQDCIEKAVQIQQHQPTNEDQGVLSPTFQNRMLVYKVARVEQLDENEGYQECPICFEEMLPGEKVGRLECLCVFHYKCIKEWFNKKLQKMKAKDAKYVGKNFCPLHDAVF